MPQARITGIYAIEHAESGTLYIGQSVNIYQRFKKHKFELRSQTHGNSKLQNAWNKYGETAFNFVILEQVDDPTLLYEREAFWVNQSKRVYNLTLVDETGMRLIKSDEERERIRAALLGINHSDERRANISRGRKGVKTGMSSEEHRRHLSEANKGQDTSKAVEASAAARRGKALSEEHKRKVGEALKGKKRPPRTAEHSEKLRLAALERQARLRAERQHQQADAVE